MIRKLSLKWDPIAPISVVIPVKPSRSEFFIGFSLPSVEANKPSEIILVEGPGTPSFKRNIGVASTNSDYIFFCDDDVVLNSQCLYKLHSAILDASIAYSNFIIVDLCKGRPSMLFKSHKWEEKSLLKGNYIDTCSLVRKSDFLKFDESLRKFEDWDLWIRMSQKKKLGVYVNEALFLSFKIDKCVTDTISDSIAREILIKKTPIYEIAGSIKKSSSLERTISNIQCFIGSFINKDGSLMTSLLTRVMVPSKGK